MCVWCVYVCVMWVCLSAGSACVLCVECVLLCVWGVCGVFFVLVWRGVSACGVCRACVVCMCLVGGVCVGYGVCVECV